MTLEEIALELYKQKCDKTCDAEAIAKEYLTILKELRKDQDERCQDNGYDSNLED